VLSREGGGDLEPRRRPWPTDPLEMLGKSREVSGMLLAQPSVLRNGQKGRLGPSSHSLRRRRGGQGGGRGGLVGGCGGVWGWGVSGGGGHVECAGVEFVCGLCLPCFWLSHPLLLWVPIFADQ